VAVNRQAAGHAAWSGGDDGLLKGWDTRTCGAGARPTFVSTAHGAGVTHVAWHPHEPHVAATGSYDEQVRLWDDRATGRGPLSAHAAGGGVWRLRWHPHASHRGLLAAACMYGGAQILVCEALQDTGAAAAADAHVDDARLLGGCRQLAHHTAHESIAYAVEWLGGPALPEAPAGCWRPSCDAIATDGPGTGDEGDGRPPRSGFALASCSFYDRSLHLWEPAASIDAA
jgi:diphthamide biosynthesis protein 7